MPARRAVSRRLRPWATRTDRSGGSRSAPVTFRICMSTDCNTVARRSTDTQTRICTSVDQWATVLLVTTQDALPRRWLTANQLVAYNISRYRRNLKMTQERLAERLSSYSGRPWSKVTVSAAERSFDGNRVRQFDADDLVALSGALEVPLPGFFLPPDDDGESVAYHLAPVRSDRATSVWGLITLFVVSRDDEGPNVELFSQLMQRELESAYGTSFQQDLSGIFDLS